MFSRPERPLVWAHRGASAQAPENTLAAFALAAGLGADGVELDVQLCGSGEPVVHHDFTLGRTTGHPGLLAELPLRELRKLDAGARFDAKFAGERIPTLAEALDALPAGVLANVELKCETLDDRGLTSAALRDIARTGAAERVLVSSFNPVCLWRARALAPRLPRALLFHHEQSLFLRRGSSASLVGAIAVHPEAELATAAAVRRWRKRGYLVAPWTVDEPAEILRLAAAGVTGLITNAPDVVLATLAGTRNSDVVVDVGVDVVGDGDGDESRRIYK